MCLMPRSERSKVRLGGANPIWVIKVDGVMKVVMCVIEKMEDIGLVNG